MNCGEAGRGMFFEHLGVYFSKIPDLKPAYKGTQCSICRSSVAPLWLTNSKDAVCIVQHTITRKRKARLSIEEMMSPVADDSGGTSFGPGHFAVAGLFTASVVTNLLPTKELPSHVTTSFMKRGSSLDAIIDLIANPPKPPFVAIAFGRNAQFPIDITVSDSALIINGPNSFSIGRARMLRLVTICRRMIRDHDIDEVLKTRARLAGDFSADVLRKESYRRDRETYVKLRNSGIITPSEFRTLPSPGTAEALILSKIIEDSNSDLGINEYRLE